jgi:exosortase/archaeosortase family protein
MKKNPIKEKNSISSILLRYLIIAVVAIPNLYFFYLIFTPLTLYPVYFLLSLFSATSISSGAQIVFGGITITLIESCIAGSAYYLLFLLNFAIPGVSVKKRFNSIVASFLLLLILNVLRIVLLSLLAYNGSAYFDITHKVFWYLLSTVFVVGIWFWEISYFKIKGYPFYDDLSF